MRQDHPLQLVYEKGMSDHLSERHVFADTEKLHRQLSELKNRVTQLEDALQIAHASMSAEQHPLLSEDLLEIKSRGGTPPGSADDIDKGIEKDELDKDILNSFGELAISNHKEDLCLTGAEQILLASHCEIPLTCEIDVPADETTISSLLSSDIGYLSKTFPFTPLLLSVDEIQDAIEDMLPSYERASALAEAYLENVSWFFRPVNREQIMEELIPAVYKNWHKTSLSAKPDSTPSPSVASTSNSPAETDYDDSPRQPRTDPHVLALLLTVFAAGAVADLTLPPYNDEAHLYHHLSRAALSLKSLFDGTTLFTVQAVMLVGTYDLFSCRKDSLEGTYKMLSFGISLASSIGLHRDPARGKYSSKMTQRRREVFWEVYSIDLWKSFGCGRPTIFYPSIVDCEFPQDQDATIDEDGIEIPSVWRWRHRFVKEVVSDVVQKLNSVQALKYSEMLALDQKIRDFGPRDLYKRFAGVAKSNFHGFGVMPYLYRYMVIVLTDNALMLLHRNFFARAILENPVNPMRSSFAPSFLSAYRSATSMLCVVRGEYDNIAHLMLRVWPIWAHALTASVILGSVAALGRTSALAPQAFVEFNLSIELFAKAQMHPVVKSGLPILLRLRNKAYRMLSPHGGIIANPVYGYQNSFLVPGPAGKAKEKEFNVIGGMGRLLRKSLEGGFAYMPTRPSDVIGAMAPMRVPPVSHSTISSTSVALPPSSDVSLSPGGTNMSVFASLPTTETSVFASRRVSGSPSREQERDPDTEINTTTNLYRFDDAGKSVKSPIPFSAGMEGVSSSGASAPSDSSDKQSKPNPGHVHGYTHDPNSPTVMSRLSLDSDMDYSYAGRSGSGPESDAQMEGQMYAPADPYSLSAMSPSTVFNTDFDVSYDMRSATGEESLLPLLPQDMEAWRTLLQDPRLFIGLANEENPV
ncbi:hypothetical protein EW145_g2474 [Phellinidium pouzarii]|uniref:Xylanolytic transcriptional activator regulatory domain-containing protein n=1 Tax=Phellinidium pouzarii TaxID=167371 RepID=A0A4V3XD91_9AGAM|nr:hypothetical protein EW145_g2474 [Phellinidium pouzarii]